MSGRRLQISSWNPTLPASSPPAPAWQRLRACQNCPELEPWWSAAPNSLTDSIPACPWSACAPPSHRWCRPHVPPVCPASSTYHAASRRSPRPPVLLPTTCAYSRFRVRIPPPSPFECPSEQPPCCEPSISENAARRRTKSDNKQQLISPIPNQAHGSANAT